jgi:hypothetical protein
MRKVRGMGGDGGRKESDEGIHNDDGDTMRMMLCPLFKTTINYLKITNNGNPRMQWTMKGQARKVRGEG